MSLTSSLGVTEMYGINVIEYTPGERGVIVSSYSAMSKHTAKVYCLKLNINAAKMAGAKMVRYELVKLGK